MASNIEWFVRSLYGITLEHIGRYTGGAINENAATVFPVVPIPYHPILVIKFQFVTRDNHNRRRVTEHV
jgi:hypothetical protein